MEGGGGGLRIGGGIHFRGTNDDALRGNGHVLVSNVGTGSVSMRGTCQATA